MKNLRIESYFSFFFFFKRKTLRATLYIMHAHDIHRHSHTNSTIHRPHSRGRFYSYIFQLKIKARESTRNQPIKYHDQGAGIAHAHAAKEQLFISSESNKTLGEEDIGTNARKTKTRNGIKEQ